MTRVGRPATTRGIGRATAHALAAAGWHIAVLDIDEASAKEAADEVAALITFRQSA